MNIGKRFKRLALITVQVLSATAIFAQSQNSYSLVDNLHPVSPTISQFSKYTDLPVGEYTGIPSIVIPLYEVEADGVKVPLALTYHAAGNRVSQDASWVGLGWDLQIGSVVQTVNGKDDYSTDCCGPYTKWLPDWQGSPVPSELPYRYNYPFSQNGGGWSNPYPGAVANSPQPYHAYKIATDYYVPINTNFDTRALTQFTSPTYDSEPDVFKANFLGHSISFMLNWNTNQLVVLNKKGYKVTRNADDTWTIVVPSGEEFDFQQKSSVNGISTDNAFNQTSGSNSLSSRIWMLTRIVTKNKQQILLNYSSTATAYSSYPFCTQKLFNVIDGGATFFGPGQGERKAFLSSSAFPSVGGNSVSTSISSSKEPYVYLSSIVFPKGQVTLSTSPRQDMVGAMKLDSIAIVAAQPVKTYKFNYSYFNAGGIGGAGYSIDTTAFSNTVSNYRLKLVSLQDNSGAIHSFTYNPTSLPKKNSYATDYWGYYNGQASNTSMVPNASQFNSAYYSSTFGNNGNNHSSNLSYATAGILQQIKYPTGGTVNFNYELNAFNNYYVPDFSTSSNTVSHGNGLRIQSVTYNQADGSQSKKEVYTYSTGKAILPVNIFRSFPLDTYVEVNGGTAQAQVSVHIYNLTELNMNGAFSQSLFGSITGVGYDTVSKQEMDLNNIPKGKTVSTYYNNPDIVTTSASSFSQLSATLPALKQHDQPENGSLKSVLQYDQQNNLLKKGVYTYSLSNSPIYYGARLFGYNNLIAAANISNGDPYYIYDQHMIGFYPLFDLETLLTSSTETYYFGTDSITSVSTKAYDQYNQLASSTSTNSNNNYEESDFQYPYSFNTPTLLTMAANNRLSDIVSVHRYLVNSRTGPKFIFSLNRTYVQSGNLFLAGRDTVDSHPGLGTPSLITYDQYDLGNGSILQYTQNGLTNSLIYDYNKQYVIAEIKNAPYSSVAYTSFEADGKGRWKYTGPNLPDKTAPTGKMDYLLSNGNVYLDSLSAAQTYVVSYWSKNGAQSVNGSTTATQGYTYNGFTYYEHKIVNPTGGTITVSGTGTIDELRLYPFNAQMSSYTYEPLVGITSTSDAGGKISYYEYDGSKRLLDIRDQSRNIIKAFCYNYAGQPTNCGVNVIYSSAAKSVPFQKSCTAGQVGVINYTLPQGAYTSTMSQQDADNQAQADVNAKGQAYANQNATCVYPYVTMTLASSIVDVNGDTQNTYMFKVFADNALTIPCAVPANLTVNYKITTTVSYSTGSPPPSTNNTNQTIVVPAGSSQVTTSQIDVYHCTGGSNPAIVSGTATTSAQQASTTGTGVTPFVIQPGTTICTSVTLTLLPGTGYQIGGFID